MRDCVAPSDCTSFTTSVRRQPDLGVIVVLHFQNKPFSNHFIKLTSDTVFFAETLKRLQKTYFNLLEFLDLK